MIQEHQTLHVTNLISVRKTLTQAEVPPIIEKLAQYIKTYNADKAGYLISTTFCVDQQTQKMDTIFYLPINKEIPSSEDFVFKPHLYLINCVMIKYKGNPQNMQPAVDGLTRHVQQNNLVPISTLYSVNQNEILRQEDLDKFEVDIYMSISPNIF
ncbi:MAG: hypothetical protein LBT44_01420 [Clostridiales bacterium]|nr:hypothetical protein [Clostridiales bacterium]